MADTSPAPTWAERKRTELRQEIIDAAFDAFAERGYHGTGIADIAQRLGIGHGTFYRYFANKRDILDHVITDLIQRILTALAAENAPEAATTLAEYRAQVQRIAEALTGIFAADPRIPRVLLFEATGIDRELTERIYGLFDTFATLTAAYFDNGVRRGYLRADLDAEYSARAVNGMLLAAVIHGLRHPGEDTHKRFAQAVINLMYDGIAAPDARPAPADGEVG